MSIYNIFNFIVSSLLFWLACSQSVFFFHKFKKMKNNDGFNKKKCEKETLKHSMFKISDFLEHMNEWFFMEDHQYM